MTQYDFIAIGGGSAGFNAARVARSLGARVAIVDGADRLGGLCILRGCMPSKTLLYATEILHLAQKGGKFGLRIPKASVDMKALQKWKRRVVGEFADYRAQVMESGRFDLYRQQARFVDPHTLELGDGQRIQGTNIIIGTGSRVSVPPIPGLADTPCWTSDDVLNLDFVPQSVIVLGGGIVACELAQFLRRIGSRVCQVQRSPHILKEHSAEAASVVEQSLRDEGIDLLTDTQLESVRSTEKGVTVRIRQGDKILTRRAQYLFNALGREPVTDSLDLEVAGVKLTESGRIAVNKWQQTSVSHIYAGGDVCGPHDIVHLAVAQGELAARHALGQKKLKPVDESLLLSVVFTSPPLASVGRSEKQLQADNIPYLSASYPFNDHGKSILMDANYGFVKILASPRTGRLLGAEIVGIEAGELIHCLSGPLALKATVFDLLKAPWYHPTLAEILTYPLEEIADQINEAD